LTVIQSSNLLLLLKSINSEKDNLLNLVMILFVASTIRHSHADLTFHFKRGAVNNVDV